jgi:hypothetical protein
MWGGWCRHGREEGAEVAADEGRGEVELYGQQGGNIGDGGWWMRECHG